jgi:predicted  nucleic acid-binding Zn-ribbon protein
VRESLRKLVDLWRVDDALLTAEAELAELPARRAAAEHDREAADAAAAEAKAALQAREGEHREAEKRLAEAEASIQRLKAEQATTRDNNRYRAIDDVDIPAIRRACDEIETRILEAMESVDEARRAHAAAEAAARSAAKRLAEQLARADARAAELAKEIERLRGARAEIAPGVDPELRAQYERVASRRRPALVLVSGAICPGCRVGIPPQILVDLISNERMAACESCKRILIHPSLLDTPA